MATLFKWYRHCCHAHPIKTNLVQTGVLFGLGDLMAQNVIETDRVDDGTDWSRTLFYATLGCAIGPTLGAWYGVLDRFGTKNTVLTVTQKILADQLFASPIINGAVMIASRAFHGDGLPDIQKKLKDDYANVMFKSYLIWPAVQTFNFAVVPQQYRVLTVQTVSLGWNAYLSYKSNTGVSAPSM